MLLPLFAGWVPPIELPFASLTPAGPSGVPAALSLEPLAVETLEPPTTTAVPTPSVTAAPAPLATEQPAFADPVDAPRNHATVPSTPQRAPTATSPEPAELTSSTSATPIRRSPDAMSWNGPLTLRAAQLSGRLWALGALLLFGLQAVAVFRRRRIAQRARPVDEAVWIEALDGARRELGLGRRPRLLVSAEAPVPMTWGLVRPVILLPEAALLADAERRREVLLHELTHVLRADHTAQRLGQLAAALHWPNPLAWRALRRLRAESELACDDRVLIAGIRPSTYAAHLLDVARGLGRGRVPADALAMARRLPLSGRIEAILDEGRSRSAPGRGASTAAVAILAGLVTVLAGITLGHPHPTPVPEPEPTLAPALPEEGPRTKPALAPASRLDASRLPVAPPQPMPAPSAGGPAELAPPVPMPTWATLAPSDEWPAELAGPLPDSWEGEDWAALAPSDEWPTELETPSPDAIPEPWATPSSTSTVPVVSDPAPAARAPRAYATPSSLPRAAPIVAPPVVASSHTLSRPPAPDAPRAPDAPDAPPAPDAPAPPDGDAVWFESASTESLFDPKCGNRKTHTSIQASDRRQTVSIRRGEM